MIFLVVDIEATCWAKEEEIGLLKEIIEIGIARVDTIKRKIYNDESFIVKPKNNISEYCTNLTGISENDVKKFGRPLREVLNTIQKKFPIRTSLWGSWGSDHQFIRTESLRKNIPYPFHYDHINFGAIFNIMNQSKKNTKLCDALQTYNLMFEGNQHSTKSDAVNLGRLSLAMFQTYWNKT